METNERDLLIKNKIVRYCDEIAQTHIQYE